MLGASTRRGYAGSMCTIALGHDNELIPGSLSDGKGLHSSCNHQLPVSMSQGQRLTFMRLWATDSPDFAAAYPCICSVPFVQDTDDMGCWRAAATGRGERHARMTATGSTCRPSTPTHPSSRSRLAVPRQQQHDQGVTAPTVHLGCGLMTWHGHRP